jgi:hypothetical protein
MYLSFGESPIFLSLWEAASKSTCASLAVQAKRDGAELCIVNLGRLIWTKVDLRLETDLTGFSEHVLKLLP